MTFLPPGLGHDHCYRMVFGGQWVRSERFALGRRSLVSMTCLSGWDRKEWEVLMKTCCFWGPSCHFSTVRCHPLGYRVFSPNIPASTPLSESSCTDALACLLGNKWKMKLTKEIHWLEPMAYPSTLLPPHGPQSANLGSWDFLPEWSWDPAFVPPSWEWRYPLCGHARPEGHLRASLFAGMCHF